MRAWRPPTPEELAAKIVENRRFHQFLEERSENIAAVRKGHKMRRAAQLRAWEEACDRATGKARGETP